MCFCKTLRQGEQNGQRQSLWVNILIRFFFPMMPWCTSYRACSCTLPPKNKILLTSDIQFPLSAANPQLYCEKGKRPISLIAPENTEVYVRVNKAWLTYIWSIHIYKKHGSLLSPAQRSRNAPLKHPATHVNLRSKVPFCGAAHDDCQRPAKGVARCSARASVMNYWTNMVLQSQQDEGGAGQAI